MRRINSQLSVLAAVIFVAAVAFAAQVAGDSTNSSAQVIEVTAKKYEFTPAEIHVKKGAQVELRIHSVDESHGLKLSPFPEGGKDKSERGLFFTNPQANGKVEKGQDQILDFVAQQPGTYEFKCAKVCGMGHGKMKGKLIVDE